MGEGYYSRFNFFMRASGCKGAPTIPGYMLAIFLTVACQHDKKQVNFQGHEEGPIFPYFSRGVSTSQVNRRFSLSFASLLHPVPTILIPSASRTSGDNAFRVSWWWRVPIA